MVEIRRRTLHNRFAGRSSSTGTTTSWLRLTYMRLALAALVLFSLLFTLVSTVIGNVNEGPSHSGPMGVHGALSTSHIRSSTNKDQTTTSANKGANAAAGGLVTENRPSNPKPYKHNLEETNIHMHLPKTLKSPELIHQEQEITTDSDPLHPDLQSAVSKEGDNGDSGAPIHRIVLDKKGTGPTTVGYVRDFVAEREAPSFRKIASSEISPQNGGIAPMVASMVQELKVSPCLVQGSPEQGLQLNPKCQDPDTPQIAYNSADFPRIWCGQEIPPHQAIHLKERCEDPIVHLFSKSGGGEADAILPSSGQGMPPMILKSHNDAILHDTDLEPPLSDCDIPCRPEKGMHGEMRYFDGEPWEIVQTWQDSYFHGQARIERTEYRQDFYYSTQSFKSSVPLSYYNLDLYSLHNRPSVDFATAKAKAFYMVDTACASPGSKRQKYFAAISKIFPVDSYGQCQHNMDLREGQTMETLEGRLAIMKEYRFVLAFDVVKEKDHISPYIWEAFLSGAVPVVVGADNLRSHVPPHSYINSGDFGNWDELAEEIKRISQNQADWESYHAWRKDEEAIAAVDAKYEFLKADPKCRLCRWGYAKKYGLGWDHGRQIVTDNYLSKQLCITSHHSLANKPFQEEWIGRYDHDENVLKKEEEETDTCDPSVTTSETVIDNDSFRLHRSIHQHDGVIDILLKDLEHTHTDGEVVLRLAFSGVRNSDGAHFANTHTTVPNLTRNSRVSSASIQDDFSKVTILADWPTTISCAMEGYLEIVILANGEEPASSGIAKRLRIIMEDMNVIHDKMTEYFPSSFGKRMIKDFVDPLEMYFPDG